MKKKIIIMGIAPCLEEDLAAILNHENYDFMAIGLDCSDRYLGRIQHVATYHAYELPEFKERRERAGGNLDYLTHAIEPYGLWVNHIWPYRRPSGTSALLGVQAAMQLGYKMIIVAGCPLTDDRYTVRWDTHRGWTSQFEEIKDKVRSMSGWTRGLLGAPTPEWLGKSLDHEGVA